MMNVSMLELLMVENRQYITLRIFIVGRQEE